MNTPKQTDTTEGNSPRENSRDQYIDDAAPKSEKSWSQVRCEELQLWYENACLGRDIAEAQRAELLAALKILNGCAERGLDQSATHDGLSNCDAIAKARAAIAKTEGV